jgi:hypothetical protein
VPVFSESKRTNDCTEPCMIHEGVVYHGISAVKLISGVTISTVVLQWQNGFQTMNKP